MLLRWRSGLPPSKPHSEFPVDSFFLHCCCHQCMLKHPDCLPIAVPPSDYFYHHHDVRCMEFVRSSVAPRPGCSLGPRDQINQVTSFLDASNVYGSSEEEASYLRLYHKGLLRYSKVQSRLPLPPTTASHSMPKLCRTPGPRSTEQCFAAGDHRVNEQPGLIALHTLWLRAHNQIATQLAFLNSHWKDERIYQETRKIIAAFMQHITYREFLPIVLGQDVVKLFELDLEQKGYYRGYHIKVNPTAANAFGTAAFRFGHSLIQPTLIRCDSNHKILPMNVSLYEELTVPTNLYITGSVDKLLLGMCTQPSQKRDEFITDQLTNHLFQTPNYRYGMDLAALNIQRGRDHGLPPYNAWRGPCGLKTFTEWKQLTKVMSFETVEKLKSVYRDVNDIDLFAGAMAEKPVHGGLVGPTFACILAQQFSNLRKGDRFWYENGGFDSSFTLPQLQKIRRISLARILCDNLDSIDTVQPFVFLTADHARNQHVPCSSQLIPKIDLFPWIEHHKVDSQEEQYVHELPVYPINENYYTKPSNEKPSDASTIGSQKPFIIKPGGGGYPNHTGHHEHFYNYMKPNKEQQPPEEYYPSQHQTHFENIIIYNSTMKQPNPQIGDIDSSEENHENNFKPLLHSNQHYHYNYKPQTELSSKPYSDHHHIYQEDEISESDSSLLTNNHHKFSDSISIAVNNNMSYGNYVYYQTTTNSTTDSILTEVTGALPYFKPQNSQIGMYDYTFHEYQSSTESSEVVYSKLQLSDHSLLQHHIYNISSLLAQDPGNLTISQNNKPSEVNRPEITKPTDEFFVSFKLDEEQFSSNQKNDEAQTVISYNQLLHENNRLKSNYDSHTPLTIHSGFVSREMPHFNSSSSQQIPKPIENSSEQSLKNVSDHLMDIHIPVSLAVLKLPSDKNNSLARSGNLENQTHVDSVSHIEQLDCKRSCNNTEKVYNMELRGKLQWYLSGYKKDSKEPSYYSFNSEKDTSIKNEEDLQSEQLSTDLKEAGRNENQTVDNSCCWYYSDEEPEYEYISEMPLPASDPQSVEELPQPLWPLEESSGLGI